MSFVASRYGEPTSLEQLIRKARLENGLRQVDIAWVTCVDEMTAEMGEIQTGAGGLDSETVSTTPDGVGHESQLI